MTPGVGIRDATGSPLNPVVAGLDGSSDLLVEQKETVLREER